MTVLKSKQIVWTVLLGIILLVFGLPAHQAGAGPAPVILAQASPSDLIAAVNNLRAANGLSPYTVSDILMQTAQGQASYMASIGSVTHYGPGGITLTQRLLAAGYPLAGDLSLGGLRAENITGGTNKTASQAVLEWQGDAPHLNTMLSPNLTEIGAGVATAGGVTYMVIDCALPTSGGVPQAYTPAAGEPTIGAYSPGDFIVPVTTSTPDAEGKVYHDVQYGQSLWAIAIAYGTKIDQIRALNGLGAETEIYQGDRLLVREDAAPAPVVLTPTAALSQPTLVVTSTPFIFPTVTPALTDTPLVVAVEIHPEQKGFSTTVVVFGIILLALIFAGVVTWLSSRKPV